MDPPKTWQGMFRDARCPVDNCTITLDQNQKADVDAIVFFGRFAHPGHSRPPQQVRAFQRLCSRRSNECRGRVVRPVLCFRDRVFEICYEAEVFLFPAIRCGNETIELPECGDYIVTLAYQFIVHVITTLEN